MSRRTGFAFLFSLLMASSSFAQGAKPRSNAPPFLPSDEADANKLLADRIRFVREMYQLDAATMDKLTRDLTAIVPFQDKYHQERAKTIMRTNLAITIVANDDNISAAEKPARIARLQDQIKSIHMQAPLSLANVCRMTEDKLPPNMVTAAHERIAKRFAPLLAGAPMAINKLDALLVPPPQPGKRPELTGATPPTPPTQVVETTAPPKPQTPQTTPVPMPPGAPPMVQQPVAPPAPPKVVAPAPPEADWSGIAEKTAARYGFNAEQKKIADRALTQCKSRAEQYRTQTKADFDEAAKMSDPAARESRMKELNKRLDILYDEMMSRIDSVATTEQKQKMAPEKPPAGK